MSIYLKQIFFFNKIKHGVLPNYIREDFSLKRKKIKLLPKNFIYLQGLTSSERYPENTLNLALNHSKENIVIAGKISENIRNIVLENNRITYLGEIESEYIPYILSKAKYTIVLYSSENINSNFCAPNRFYWPLGFGIPVFCGLNPPFKEVENKFKSIYCSSTDGKNYNCLVESLKIFQRDFTEITKNCLKHKQNFILKNNFLINKYDFTSFKRK